MELTRKDTKMLQGLSVLAMLCLHLFDRTDPAGLYEPFARFGEVTITYMLGQLSDFCVMGFAFCTGYVHYQLKDEDYFFKKRLKGLLSLLITYWVVLVVFSVVGLLTGKNDIIPANVGTFVLHALLLNNSYNGAWWYMLTYALLVLFSPLLMKVVKRYHWCIVLTIGFVIYCAGYYLRFGGVQGSFVLDKLGPFMTTLFEYLIGAICAKCLWFTHLDGLTDKLPKLVRIAIASILWLGMLVGHSMVVRSLFIAPLTGLCVFSLFALWRKPEWIEKFFLFVGNHATNIWLVHMFFYSKMFPNLVFVAKYPIPIYLFMLGLRLGTSLILTFIQKPLRKLVLH